MSGFVETRYGQSEVRSEDSAGATSRSDSRSLTDRLSLAYLDNLFPLVTLRAGGLFERSQGWLEDDAGNSTSTTDQLNSYADLTFGNRYSHGGIGYSRRQVAEDGGGGSTTLVRESYQASLGFQPDDLPSLEVQALRTNSFDLARRDEDLRTDHLSWSSRYSPLKDLQLDYNGVWNENKDHVIGTTVTELSNAGRASYSTRFFRGRGSFAASYNVSRQDTDFQAVGGAGGEVPFGVPALAGLSGLSATPEEGVLAANPALVDGNLTASSGVDLGLPPIEADRSPRNLGLDFGAPVKVNGLEVWVDRDLPAQVASWFTWDVYVSSDNVTWTKHQTIAGAPFGPFDTRFLLRFTQVTTRFLKVVVSPLAPTVVDANRFPNVPVTELRAFQFVTGQSLKGHSVRMSQSFDTTIRTLLLENPSLSYDFAYFYTNALAGDSTRYTVVNGLSLSRRLAETVTGSARVSREDSVDPSTRSSAYTYSASVMANPLPTLTHNLVLSGRIQRDKEESTRSESAYLTNTAALYPGVDVSVAGGVTRSSSSEGKESRSTTVTAGASVIPHPRATINLSYSESLGRQSDSGASGAAASGSSHSRRAEASLSLNPTNSLYFFGSVGLASEKDRPLSTIKSYSIGWSPFQGGALQLSTTYSETIRSEDASREKSLAPSVTWRIGPRISLDGSYLRSSLDSSTQKSTTWSYSAGLRATF